MVEFPKIPGVTLLERCGCGTVGEVWLGRALNRNLHAVRLVSKKRDPALLAMERRAMSRYRPLSGQHANLMKILDAGETAGYLYSITEPADNIFGNSVRYEPDTLDRRLKSRKLTSAKILSCLEDILSGIRYLHKRNVSHGDLKPENILFVGGVLKIGDPGLVGPADKCCSAGSAGFRPPWDAKGKECDIYAFGKLVYTLCTRANPQRFPEIPEQCDLSAFMPLNEIALGCCESDPHRRFRDADEILRVLKQVRIASPTFCIQRCRAE